MNRSSESNRRSERRQRIIMIVGLCYVMYGGQKTAAIPDSCTEYR